MKNKSWKGKCTMKKCICFILSIAMLLTLCACSTSEPTTEPTTLPSATPTAEPSTEPTTVPTTAPTVPTTEPTEPVFEPITIYDDAKYGKVQLISLQHGMVNGTLCGVATFTVTNSSDSIIYCRLGEAVYINDVMASPVTLQELNDWVSYKPGQTTSFTYNVEIKQGQTETIQRVIPVASLDEANVDISVNITYDNGEIGAYNEKIELMNDAFRIHTGETAVSEKYAATGDELFAADSDAYKLVVTDYGEKQEFNQKRYWVSMYLENTSENDITFCVEDNSFDDKVRASSDKQDKMRYMNVFLNCNFDCVTLAPGKGFYLVVEVYKEDVDCLALDASEVITLNIPIFAWDGSDDGRTYTWKDRHVVQVTREQFVNGFNELENTEPTTEPTVPVTEPTVPATEPTTAPTTEPTMEPTTEPVIPDDPGDIGGGGVPDLPGGIGY